MLRVAVVFAPSANQQSTASSPIRHKSQAATRSLTFFFFFIFTRRDISTVRSMNHILVFSSTSAPFSTEPQNPIDSLQRAFVLAVRHQRLAVDRRTTATANV